MLIFIGKLWTNSNFFETDLLYSWFFLMHCGFICPHLDLLFCSNMSTFVFTIICEPGLPSLLCLVICTNNPKVSVDQVKYFTTRTEICGAISRWLMAAIICQYLCTFELLIPSFNLKLSGIHAARTGAIYHVTKMGMILAKWTKIC